MFYVRNKINLHRSDRSTHARFLTFSQDTIFVYILVFSGNTNDPSTVPSQVATIQQRFAIRNLVLVGDRGMITSAPITEDLKPAGFDWISVLRTDELRKAMALSEESDPVDLLENTQ